MDYQKPEMLVMMFAYKDVITLSIDDDAQYEEDEENFV